jgi:hypothetical protein
MVRDQVPDPILNIRIAAPCSADWDKMAGDDRVRYCEQCRLHVYNLSAMSAQEARNLIAKSEGRLCVRFYQRRDGTVLTKDCPVGLKVVMRRLARVAGIAFSALVNVLPVLTGCARPLQGQMVQAESSLDLLVVDPQGAVCPGAKVEILRDGQRVGNMLSANNEGVVQVRHLLPGLYRIKVSYPNFDPHEKTVTLKSAGRLNVKVTLRVAVLQGAAVVIRSEVIQVIQPPTPLLEPVPVPHSKPARRSF